jgi:serine/threonine-protein kinase
MRTPIPELGERWREVDRLLDQALDSEPNERSALLDRECSGDHELRAAVDAMLRACHDSEGFLEDQPGPSYVAPIVAATVAAGPDGPPVATEGIRIGPYRIVRELGHGGMGVVYLADRADDQYRHRVALKLMRGGAWVAGDNHLARRFREERQILASLEHPGIARLLDGGVTADGSPWFALEYVDGTAIDRYCDAARLTILERITLFCSVCDAVAFAHRNLVVHRDLKPSNLLVTERREVKLLDFGIAKLLAHADGADGDAVTRTIVRALTPEYASPEHIRGERVATASDVYSLGVILYELLTGRRPYAAGRASLHDIERAVLDDAPTPPSAVVGRNVGGPNAENGDSTRDRAVAEARNTTPERLRRTLEGDLDAIVLTAIRKEPDRRYTSADQLAGDLRRYLAGLPVTARRDGRAYRAGKFIRRHRAGVAATALGALLLLGFSIVTAVQSARLRAQAERITIERDRAQQVSGFLVTLFRSADPFSGSGPATTVREVLDSGAARVDRELADQPELRAELLRAIGMSYMSLGLAPDARRLLERALAIPNQAIRDGEPHEVSVKQSLAQVLQELAQYQAAESLYRDVLDWRRRALPPGHTHIARSLTTLATAVSAQARYAEAEVLVREALAIDRAQHPADPRSVSQSLNNLGNILTRQGRYAAAESTHREAYAIRRAAVGEDHPETANSLVNIAAALGQQGRLREADSLFRIALAVKRARLGERHVDVATDEAGFAQLLELEGNYREAEVLFRHAIETHRRWRPDGHPRTATALLGLGELLMARGDARAAEPYLREALRSVRAALPPEHPSVAHATRALDRCLAMLDRPATR